MVVSRHFLISALVSCCIAVLFAVFVRYHEFELSEEYQLIPEGMVLPRGVDVKIDMQSGETWARIGSMDQRSDIVLTEASDASDNTKDNAHIAAPEYKNVTKSRIQARLSAQDQERIEVALSTLGSVDSIEFLEEEAAAMEFGLAVLEARNFGELQKLSSKGNVGALKIVANCLQNNPLAVEKFLQLERAKVLNENLELVAFKAFLRLVESVKKYGGEMGAEFIKEIDVDVIKFLTDKHKDSLEERYTGLLVSIQ